MRRLAHKHAPRYALVALAGFAVDFAVAMVLVELAGLAMLPAAAAGFVAGLLLNYVLFERWAFASKADGSLSWQRFGGTVAASLLALLTRLAVVAGLSSMIAEPKSWAAVVFLVAAGTSFFVNFVLVQQVFRRHPRM